MQDNYNKLKGKYPKSILLIKDGSFYISMNNDAIIMNILFGYKLKQVIKYYHDEKPVLECGCGTGKTTMFLSCFGTKTYAMDLEKEIVESAKKRFKKYKCKCKVIKGDINNIPFKDKFFSVTHSSGVLEHYSDSEIVNMINE